MKAKKISISSFSLETAFQYRNLSNSRQIQLNDTNPTRFHNTGKKIILEAFFFTYHWSRHQLLTLHKRQHLGHRISRSLVVFQQGVHQVKFGKPPGSAVRLDRDAATLLELFFRLHRLAEFRGDHLGLLQGWTEDGDVLIPESLVYGKLESMAEKINPFIRRYAFWSSSDPEHFQLNQ